uniref:Uncharacterized protein n=1 Tax=Romanomermis culicivorax TaxID=13658 RepID=A0A915IHT0_ROMCU
MYTNFCALLLLWPQLAVYGYTMPQQYSADVLQKRAEAAVLAANGGYGSVPVPNYGKEKCDCSGQNDEEKTPDSSNSPGEPSNDSGVGGNPPP